MPRGKTQAFAALALAGGLALPALSFADGGRFGMHGMHGMRGLRGRMAETLNLTEAQQSSARKLRDDLRAKAEPLFEQARTQRDELEALLDSAHPDALEVGNKAIAMHATHLQIKALHGEFETKFSALLNGDQLAKFQKMQAMREEFRGRHGFGGPPPGEE